MKEKVWLDDLASFIVEANTQTWAAGRRGVEPERPGYKELEYSQGLWRLRDSYTGYFRAPGMTTVYYKNIPSWTNMYGGHGMKEDSEDLAKSNFDFLKMALMEITLKLPYRGPQRFPKTGNIEGVVYNFEILNGDFMHGMWGERIHTKGALTFAQVGIHGIVIHRDHNRKPIMPWEL